MRWSYRIVRVAGIDVKIHVTFLLLLAWLGAMRWQTGGLAGAAEGVGFTLLLFLCVLLHEFGHAFAARAYGIRTPDITLLPIGGVARLERMPDKPVQELVVAIAGPAVNVVIAAILFFVLAAKFRFSELADLDQLGESLPANLLAVNVMLVVFNAIPAFPMDGGRVLRALLAMKFDYVLATTIAARVGQVLAGGFAVAGLLGFGSPMLVLIAAFVFMGAQQEVAYARFRSGARARKVSDIMHAQFAALPADTPVRHALALVRDAAQPFYPVIDHGLRAVGVVTREALDAASGAGRGEVAVATLVSQPARVQASSSLDALLSSAVPGAPIVVENPSGQVVGVLAVHR